MKLKNKHAVIMGRKGGRSTSPKKLKAIAKNLEKAREARLKDKNK